MVAASARMHKINELLWRQIQQVIQVNAPVGELAERPLLLQSVRCLLVVTLHTDAQWVGTTARERVFPEEPASMLARMGLATPFFLACPS